MATLGSWVSPVRPMAFPYLTANFVFSKYQKRKRKKGGFLGIEITKFRIFI
jgi:hypothetical protein